MSCPWYAAKQQISSVPNDDFIRDKSNLYKVAVNSKRITFSCDSNQLLQILLSPVLMCVKGGLLHSEPAPLHRKAKNGHAWDGWAAEGAEERGRSGTSIPSLRHDQTPCMSHGGTYPACIVARTTPGVPKLLFSTTSKYASCIRIMVGHAGRRAISQGWDAHTLMTSIGIPR